MLITIRFGHLLAALLLWAIAALTVFAAAAPGKSDKAARQQLLDQYCVGCHNDKAKVAGLVLANSHPENPASRPELWEKVIRKIGAGEMPPPALPRPSATVSEDFRNQLITDLDNAARRDLFAGHPVIRRLNRTEYQNAIRDLLALDLPLADELPQDGIAAGFDNIGDALSMSPLLLERYLKVARKVSQFAVGVVDPSPVTEVFAASPAQSAWLGEGFPFGTRGGIRVSFYFPLNGEYNLRAFIGRDGLPHPEGIRFFQTKLALNAGTHTVVVTFPDEFAEREGPVPNIGGAGGAPLGGPLDTRGSAIRPTIEFRVDSHRVKLFEIGGISVGEAAFGGQPGPPTLDRLEISGPYDVKGIGNTPGRQKIFVCRPTRSNDEERCASRILTALTTRAFRRDVSKAEVQPFFDAYASARPKHSFDEAIALAIRNILLAPDFLFRLEFDRPSARPGSAQTISNWELASRLSFFLWSSIPDDQLLNAARTGTLAEPTLLDHEVRRMLADPRATALRDNFGEQWLGLRSLKEIKPDRTIYPEFNAALAATFEEETRLFIRSVMHENRSVLEMIGANYTYLNGRLAEFYGIPGVMGPGFRRVALPSNSERGGLLGQGSILLLTSHTTKTSPILRGKWILTNLLNSPPPPPPPGVPPLNEAPDNGRKLTTRQQVERHRNNAMCASCHSRIDPLGFALESFDVIGKWRTHDEGGDIDTSAKVLSGDTFSGPSGLKSYLLSHPDQFVDATVSRLLTYALGRELEPRDRPTVRRIMQETKPGGYRFNDIVLAIIKSVPFQMKQTQENPS